jgi:hypothetical protein
MVIEAAIFIPVMVLLIVGMVQFGKITYQYYVIKKIVYGAARQISVQQGINFCDIENDAGVQSALALAVNDITGTPLIPNLTAQQFQISTFCAPADPASPPAPCDQSGCPTAAQRPDYIQVSIPAGYTVRPRILYVDLSPFELRPVVTIPFGGIS